MWKKLKKVKNFLAFLPLYYYVGKNWSRRPTAQQTLSNNWSSSLHRDVLLGQVEERFEAGNLEKRTHSAEEKEWRLKLKRHCDISSVWGVTNTIIEPHAARRIPHLTDSLDVSLQLHAAFFLLLTGEGEYFLGRKWRKLSELGQVFLQLFVKAIELTIAKRRVESAIDVDIVNGKRLLIPAHSYLLRIGDGKVHDEWLCESSLLVKRKR